MSRSIRIKPHHFIDILRSLGEGRTKFQPHPYGHAVHSVTERLLADRDAGMEVELGADDVCRACIHNIDGVCDDTIDTSFRPNAPPLKREWNLLLDRRWCDRLGLAPADRLTARELCLRVRDRAGDITDIYREIPADRIAARAANLQKGVESFLARRGTGCQ